MWHDEARAICREASAGRVKTPNGFRKAGLIRNVLVNCGKKAAKGRGDGRRSLTAKDLDGSALKKKSADDGTAARAGRTFEGK